MNGFFKPQRRKIGVVTLALACLFAAGWVRSYFARDTILVQDAGLYITSAIGGMQWEWGYTYEIPGPAIQWGTFPIPNETPEYLTEDYGFPSLSYWLIVIPLTLLSAWLLLSKPKPRKPSREQQVNA